MPTFRRLRPTPSADRSGMHRPRRRQMRPRRSPLRPPRSPPQRFDLLDRGHRSCPSCCHRRIPRPQPKRPVRLHRRLAAARFFGAPSKCVRKQRSRKAGAAADRRRRVSPAPPYAPAALRCAACAARRMPRAGAIGRVRARHPEGRRSGSASTLRSGNASPRRRKSAFRRRTITGSRSFGRVSTPRVKRCGSSISSSAEKLLECPLCGVAVRNRRCSKHVGQLPHRPCQLARNRVTRPAGRRGMMRLIEDEQGTRAKIAEHVT